MVNAFAFRCCLFFVLFRYQRHKNKVLRRYNDFVALHELLSIKYPFRIVPQLPPKKTVNSLWICALLATSLAIYQEREREIHLRLLTALIDDDLFSLSGHILMNRLLNEIVCCSSGPRIS